MTPKVPTPEERIILLEQYEKARKREISASRKVKELRDLLACGCTHPEAYVKPYRWEHDNGYGRQHWVDGKYCSLCGAIDSYGRGQFYHREELRDDY